MLRGYMINDMRSHESNGEIQLQDPTWQTLGAAIEGFFEIVRLRTIYPDRVMCVNDCGAINDMPLNPLASAIAGQWIFGPAVILREGIVDGEPDLISLTDDDIDLMTVLYR